jgi:hypothetical protein
MIVDITTFLRSIPQGSEVTICIRSLDGLTLIEDSLHSFIYFVDSDCQLKALMISQIKLYTDATYHSRMEPLLGLGNVIAFTGDEQRM